MRLKPVPSRSKRAAAACFNGYRDFTRAARLGFGSIIGAMSNFTSNADLLRAEIAAAAARMIAEDGADYAGAKRKAARQILGNTKVRGNFMTDNEQFCLLYFFVVFFFL